MLGSELVLLYLQCAGKAPYRFDLTEKMHLRFHSPWTSGVLNPGLVSIQELEAGFLLHEAASEFHHLSCQPQCEAGQDDAQSILPLPYGRGKRRGRKKNGKKKGPRRDSQVSFKN